MLAESELEQIRDEAKEKYPLPTVQYMVSTHTVVRAERQACIAALTSEREKIKELVEALEGICKNFGRLTLVEIQRIATNSLTNYQKTYNLK